MKGGSLRTRSFRRIHLSVFRYRWFKNGFTGPKSFRGFRETGPWSASTIFDAIEITDIACWKKPYCFTYVVFLKVCLITLSSFSVISFVLTCFEFKQKKVWLTRPFNLSNWSPEGNPEGIIEFPESKISFHNILVNGENLLKYWPRKRWWWKGFKRYRLLLSNSLSWKIYCSDDHFSLSSSNMNHLYKLHVILQVKLIVSIVISERKTKITKQIVNLLVPRYLEAGVKNEFKWNFGKFKERLKEKKGLWKTTSICKGSMRCRLCR